MHVVMPEEGSVVNGQQPAATELIGRIASYASLHKGFRPSTEIETIDDVQTIRRANANPDWFIDRRASIYARYTPDNRTIIKAFDNPLPMEGVTQYAVMSALHATLPGCEPDGTSGLQAPEQFALLHEPTSGHQTIIMEHKDGITIGSIKEKLHIQHPQATEAVNQAADSIRASIEANVRSQVPWSIRPFLNDLTRDLSNVHVPASTSTPREPEDLAQLSACITVLDQPYMNLRAHVAARLAGVKIIDQQIHQSVSG